MAGLRLRGSLRNTTVCAVSHIIWQFCYFGFNIQLHTCRVPLPRRERGLLMKGEEIQAEMIQLLKQQTEAVEKEVFGGLTDTEEQEYSERKERISELQTKLHIKPAL